MSGFRASLLGALVLACPAAAAERPRLGVSVLLARDGFHEESLVRLSSEGFTLVSFVPTYPYVDENRIDLSGGPSWTSVEDAIAAALSRGLAVVVKPHLDPPAYIAGYRLPPGARLTGGAGGAWRGRFELDPMCADYREGIVENGLEAVARALARQKGAVPPVRFELGSELLESEVRHPERWLALLDDARRLRKTLGLDGRVLLSHNFAHHAEIAKDFLDRLDAPRRAALASYIRGLDAIALSQYMDLTAAVPTGESRLPTPDEVARALVLHEAAFERGILEKGLGLKPSEIPPLHIGEFGVGSGGLKAPNLWSGALTAEQEKSLDGEIALGMRGLTRYLSLKEGRLGRSAALWDVGRHYDIFGWQSGANAVPAAAEAVRAYLKAR